jgi:flagellar basal body P-ring formation protein FlgA
MRRISCLCRMILPGLLAAMLPGVPAALAQVELLPVPRIVIYPGDVISSAMIEDRNPPAAPGSRDLVFTSRAQVVGRIARRTLLPGQAIALNAVREPDAVKSGKPVTLVFRTGTLVITSGGIAMQAGAVGDTISAQAQDSGAVVRGVVHPDGTLRLGE